MTRRSQQIAVALIGVLVPLAASAQNGGSVTVAPAGASAPVISLQFLGLLAVALTVIAAWMIRRPGRVVGSVVALVSVAMTAGIAYSVASNVIISGGECDEVTVKPFDAHAAVDLQSQCPSPIRVIAIDLACDDPCDGIHGETLPLPGCEVGSIVNPGQACRLPSCLHT